MCNEILIFSGPTIEKQEALEYLDARYLPPARQGDIYKYYEECKPDIIGLIDGFFENTASPWHKEILYVMSKGCHVYGASSMGALRAAELADFGMQGVGKIFSAYKTGAIVGDDEVAVLHGPKEIGYPALSEALVNIRETLLCAKDESVISKDLHDLMIKYAISLFYKNRNYGTLIAYAQTQEKYTKEAEKLSLWLSGNVQNIKKLDAIDLLLHIRNNQPKQESVNFYFEETLVWKKMCAETDISNIASSKKRVLKKVNLFSGMSMCGLALISSSLKKVQYKAGDSLFQKGDISRDLYIVNSGLVQISTVSEDGKEIILNILGAGEHFGEIAFFDEYPRTASATVIQAAELYVLSKSDWNRFSDQISSADWSCIIQSICKLTRKTSLDIEAHIFLDSRMKTIRAIYRLALLDNNAKNGHDITVKVSQERLASMVGVTREMTNKVLSVLEQENLVVRRNRRLVIPNIHKLQDEFEKESSDEYLLPNMA